MSADEKKKGFGLLTKGLAGMCHHCPICPYADKKPDSAFGKAMRWHRTWCPGNQSHVKVYGVKTFLSI